MADACLFLLSNSAALVTGTDPAVDGRKVGAIVFGAKCRLGLTIRTVCLARATTKLGLANLVSILLAAKR